MQKIASTQEKALKGSRYRFVTFELLHDFQGIASFNLKHMMLCSDSHEPYILCLIEGYLGKSGWLWRMDVIAPDAAVINPEIPLIRQVFPTISPNLKTDEFPQEVVSS